MRRAAGEYLTPSLRLVREVGRGGMGSVWAADDLTLRKRVAVKLLHDASLGDQDAIERFSGEAAAGARIDSPHVARVLDHGASRGVPYIVMELLLGEDLAECIRRRGPLSLRETVDVVTQVSKALTKVHELGIVHRDVKPANVFLTKVGAKTFARLLDFGLAQDAARGDAEAQADTILGTPHYMSPEQADGVANVTPQSDLWSLAVLACKCLTGTLPFEAVSLIGLCGEIHDGRYIPPTRLRPDLPEALDAWCARAFRVDPAERFASATEMAEAFAAAAAHHVDEAYPSRADERARRDARRVDVQRSDVQRRRRLSAASTKAARRSAR